MKPYSAGTPYTAQCLNSILSRIERFARQARMDDLLADGVDAFIGFQDQLASLQMEIQRDIGVLKKRVRKDKQLAPALDALRKFRWYSRCLGDALAWQVFVHERKAIAALMSGTRPPVAEQTHNTKAVFAMAGYLLGQQFGVPIVHDITNWLRIGDITFLRFNDEAFSWRFQTVELKSSVGESDVSEDGIVEVHVTVNIYSNESLELSIDTDASTRPDSESRDDRQEVSSDNAPYKPDRRLERQFHRLDGMIARRDMKDNAITEIDGIPNLVFRLPHAETHHWSDFRRAIRNARRDGYASFSIDNFIAYAVFYRKEGVSEDHMSDFREAFAEDVVRSITAEEDGPNGFILVRQIPMLEEYDIEGFPIMRFFNYKIPKIAVDDLLHNRLAVAAMANFARVDAALVNQGFTASGITSGGDNEGYPYSIDVGWPTGETLRFKIPSTQVSREVERALYEFSGLDDVVRHLASVKLLPDLIPYDEWEASLKSEATDQD